MGLRLAHPRRCIVCAWELPPCCTVPCVATHTNGLPYWVCDDSRRRNQCSVVVAAEHQLHAPAGIQYMSDLRNCETGLAVYPLSALCAGTCACGEPPASCCGDIHHAAPCLTRVWRHTRMGGRTGFHVGRSDTRSTEQHVPCEVLHIGVGVPWSGHVDRHPQPVEPRRCRQARAMVTATKCSSTTDVLCVSMSSFSLWGRGISGEAQSSSLSSLSLSS